MSLTSATYLAFVLAVALVFYAVPRRMQVGVLIAASVAFYASLAWYFPLVLGVLVLGDFALGRALGQKPSRGLLAFGIGAHLALFFAAKALSAGGLGAGLAVPDAGSWALVPLGFSFYTLAAVSYLVDVHRGVVPAATWPQLALFFGYFPKMLAGPIERAGTFLPQLRRARVLDVEALARAGGFIALGLFRKLVLADTLAARLPESVFNRPESRSATALVAWLLAYGLVVYNDFAGYSDLARGVSALFGIELSPNFRRPLSARSFSDLWTRWHMTLSSWLRDYVYMPLARFLLRRVRNPRAWVHAVAPSLGAMLASGLWHGATAGMLAWGAIMGACLAVEQMVRAQRPVARPGAPVSWVRRATARALVLGVGLLALVPFRAGFPETWLFWKALVRNRHRAELPPSVAAVLLATLLLDRWLGEAPSWPWRRWPAWARALLLALAVGAMLLASRTQPPAPFVYQAF